MSFQRHFLSLAAAALVLGQASTALAIFDVQALVGRRWYEFDNGTSKSGVQSQEINIAAHLDPIPLVPVAFGVSAALGTLNSDDMGGNEATSFEGCLEVMAWLPLVPVVTPYARLKYPVVGSMVTKTKDAAPDTAGDQEGVTTSKLEGLHLNAGIKWSPVPLVKLLLEVGMGMQETKVEEYKIAGAKTDFGTASTDAPSKVFLVGIEVGI